MESIDKDTVISIKNLVDFFKDNLGKESGIYITRNCVNILWNCRYSQLKKKKKWEQIQLYQQFSALLAVF